MTADIPAPTTGAVPTVDEAAAVARALRNLGGAGRERDILRHLFADTTPAGRRAYICLEEWLDRLANLGYVRVWRPVGRGGKPRRTHRYELSDAGWRLRAQTSADDPYPLPGVPICGRPAEQFVDGLDDGQRTELREVLRRRAAADHTRQLVDLLRTWVADRHPGRQARSVIFSTSGFTNGYFLTALGAEVLFADGSRDDPFPIGGDAGHDDPHDRVDALLTDLYGTCGPDAQLVVDLAGDGSLHFADPGCEIQLPGDTGTTGDDIVGDQR